MVFPEQVNGDNKTDYAGQVVSQPISIIEGAPVMVVLQKDGAPNPDTHTVSLFKGGEEQYQLTEQFDGIYSDIVSKGEYDIYVDESDTGYDIITDENEEGTVINYYTVSLTAGTGIKSVSGNGTYLKGTNVPIHAEMSEGYSFGEWKQTSDNTKVSTENEYLIRNIEYPHVYTAVGKAAVSKKSSEGTSQENTAYPDIPVVIHFTSLLAVDGTISRNAVAKGTAIDLEASVDFSNGVISDNLKITAEETGSKKLGLKFGTFTKTPGDVSTGTIEIKTNNATPGTAQITVTAVTKEGTVRKTVKKALNLTVNAENTDLTYQIIHKSYGSESGTEATVSKTDAILQNLAIGDGIELRNVSINKIIPKSGSIKVTSSDSSVITLNAGTTQFEAKGAGTALITVSAIKASDNKPVTDTFRVTVVGQESKKTSITTDKDVINKAKKAQYEQVTCTVKTNNVSVNAASISINEVEKLSGDKKRYTGADIPFAIQSPNQDTFSLVIKDNAANLDELSGKYRIKYTYTGVQPTTGETLEPFELTVTKETPTVTIKQTKKANLFHVGLSENKIQKVGDESKGRIQVVPKNASQYNVAFTGGDFTIPVITDQTGSGSNEPQGMGISSADVSISANVVTQEKKVKQLSKKVNYTITFPEFRGEGNGDYQQTGSLTIAAATTKPKFSAVMKNPVLYTRFDMNQTKLSILLDGTEVPETSLSINEVPSNQSIPDGQYLLFDNRTNIDLLLTGADPTKVLWMKNTEDEAGRKTTTATLTLKKSTWTSPLTTKVKLIVDNNLPTAKLTKGTLNLNNRYVSYEQASTDIRLQNAEGFKVTRMKITPMDQKTVAVSNKINVMYQSGTQTIKTEFKNGVTNVEVKKGTYNYLLIPYYTAKVNGTWKTSAGQALQLKTVVSDKDITLAVTGKGTIDLPIRKTTGITYTPKVQNITGTITKVELTGVNRDLFELTDIGGVVGTGVGSPAVTGTGGSTVTGKTNPTGTVYVQAKAGSNLRKGTKYPIYLKYTLQTVNGRITKSSKALTVTPKQTTAKVNWTSTGKTNYTTKLSDWSVSAGLAPNKVSNKKQLTFTIQKPAGAKIDKIVAQDPSGLFEFAYSSDGANPGAAIKGETDGYIRVIAKDITKVNLKKAYKVKFKIYLEDSAVNAKPITTTVKIKITK